ncbi:MAG: T9SS type A sorting domain-containing protein [Ignavibacteriales bacterium]|nr:T9SS type A sorting domain-containing protein [Ignavibacteriales bacterium]
MHGNGPVTFGKGFTSADYLLMNLDEFRIWSTAKDSASIVRNMNRTINTTSAGLKAYWKMDEGKGPNIFDYATKLNSGNIIGPVSFQDDRAPIRNTAFSTANGYYIAEGINYGTSTNFTIFPSLGGRSFVPEERVVTLSTSNTAVNNIDFTDVSQIPVTGFITHNGTCLNDTTVEVLVDDSSWSPQVFTNADGKYLIDFPPGSSHKISPKRTGYLFTPAFIQVDTIRAPLANRNFTQQTRYNLTVKVSGGLCEKPLGGTSEVKITALPECTGLNIPVQQITGASLTTTFSGLPPLVYRIEVTRPAGDITFTADTVDLSNSARLKKITYTAPLQAAVDMRYVPTVCETVNLYNQLQKYKIRYKAFELYGTDTCFVDSCWIYINNSINDRNVRDSLLAVNGTVIDSFWAGTPNPLGGGAHPYQKSILVSAKDLTGRISNTSELWAVVSGIKPRNGQTFSSRSPEIPLMILRKPPGDQSYSYITQSSTLYNSFSLSVEKGYGTQRNYFLSLGVKFTGMAGLGFLVGSEIVPIVQQTGVMNTSHNNTTTNQLQTTMTATETITTNNPNIVSEFSGGDVFFGVAYNVVYGLTDSVYYNTSACSVGVKTGIIMAPDSIKTKFVYTEDYVRNTQIPSLYALQTKKDTLYAHNWEGFLAYNDSLKANSNDSLYNVSFSAGSQYSYTTSFQQDKTFSIYDEMPSDSAFGFLLGVLIQEAGITAGGEYNFSYNIGKQTDVTNTTYNETGYTLSDDDNGDGYTVNIAKDRVYGTPVYRTVAGQSSCPYEGGTLPRDGAIFQTKHVSASNVHPDSFAVWPISLGNNSATAESRDYTLRILNETNPDGLSIAVNGIILENAIAYTIPYGQIQTILMVKRGPSSNTYQSPYTYQNIQMVLSPACGDDSQSDTLTIDNLIFQKPCSPIALTAPEDNWLMTSAHRDTLPVTIGGYNKAFAELTEVWLQYREVVGVSNRPFNGFARKADAAIDGDFIMPRYNLTGYPVLPFPKVKNVKQYYANRSDTYNALIENRYHLLNDKKYAMVKMPQPTPINRKASGNKKITKAIADDESPSTKNTPMALAAAKSNSVINPGEQIDGLEGLWTNIKIIAKDSLGDNFTTWKWVNAGLDDGTYEIRALSKCNGVSIDGQTAILSGVIDRTGPMVQGLPQPHSGILTSAGQIAISFTEPIQRSGITAANNIGLVFTSGPSSGQACDFNFSNDGTTIVITPNVPDRFLENQTLRATVKHVTDIHGNPMRVPLGTTYIDSTSWEFVVQKSPVRWLGGDITIVKYADETVQVTRQLVNISGFPSSYYLRNIPNWLSVSSVQGTVPNQGNVPITFTFGTGITNGDYNITVTDSTVFGDQPLRIHVQVICRPPNWQVIPAAYQYSMNIIGQLYIDSTVSVDINDKVAAFVGNDIRGFAHVQRQNSGLYRLFLTVYSNQESGEQLQFRIWDSSSCSEIGQILETYTFTANAVLGTYTNPALITATTQSIVQYNLPVGWTWLSFNTRSTDMSVSKVLAGLQSSVSDIIKDQSSFAQYVSNGVWFGSLDTIRNTKMYMMKIARADTLSRVGFPAQSPLSPLYVDSGWNYIGYVPQQALTVDAALSSINAKNGDLIKSQFTFATYDQAEGWVGNMFYMQPKLGYLLKVSSSDTLIYPAGTENIVTPLLAESDGCRAIEGQKEWTLDVNKYQYSMSVIAELSGGIIDSINEHTAIGLFAGNECRGFVTPVFDAAKQSYKFYLSVYANKPVDDSLLFRVYDAKSERTLELQAGLRFVADKIVGSYSQPIIIQGNPLEVRDGRIIPIVFALMQNYPNPFNPSTVIGYAVPQDSEVEITIYNVMGEKIRTLVREMKQAGYYSATWNGKNEYGRAISSGIYIYSMKAGKFQSTKKLTFLK